MHKFAYILSRCGAQFLVTEAGIHLHHFAANVFFANVPGTIGAVAIVDPVGGGAGDEPLLERPRHESITRIAAPKRPIAIEDRDFWLAFQNQPLELRGGPLVNIDLRRRQTSLNPSQMFFQLYSLLKRACFAREGLKKKAGVPQKMYPKSQHSSEILRGRKAAWIRATKRL